MSFQSHYQKMPLSTLKILQPPPPAQQQPHRTLFGWIPSLASTAVILAVAVIACFFCRRLWGRDTVYDLERSVSFRRPRAAGTRGGGGCGVPASTSTTTGTSTTTSTTATSTTAPNDVTPLLRTVHFTHSRPNPPARYDTPSRPPKPVPTQA